MTSTSGSSAEGARSLSASRRRTNPKATPGASASSRWRSWKSRYAASPCVRNTRSDSVRSNSADEATPTTRRPERS
ncbi:Uncharacterised protein [Mycobacteroides abscessus]|nr:Uncharacterised protein [Mycobacteroides abscessus]